jgi:ABC-type phosphate transport system substrate-binding protein
MMKKLLLTALAAGLTLTFGTSCVAPEEGSNESMTTEEAGTTTAQGSLMTYNGPAENIPVTAQYPDTMEVMGTGSGEGVGVFFTFKPQGNALDDAKVHVFFRPTPLQPPS